MIYCDLSCPIFWVIRIRWVEILVQLSAVSVPVYWSVPVPVTRVWTDLSVERPPPCRLGKHWAGTRSPVVAELIYDERGLLSPVD